MYKPIAIAVTRALVPHDLRRHDGPNCDEHGVQFVVGHGLGQVVDNEVGPILILIPGMVQGGIKCFCASYDSHCVIYYFISEI